uniref:BAR domain-containing protein n=1 Tax=Globodera pallida TaxID=36090 RepID=A0A183BIL9_GLOPA
MSYWASEKKKIPKEFVDGIEQLRLFDASTKEVALWLQKTASVGSPDDVDNKRKGKKDTTNEGVLEAMGTVCKKYSARFFGTDYGMNLVEFGEACKRIGKNGADMQYQVKEKVLVPLKMWKTDKYPIIIKNLKKCKEREEALHRAEKLLAANPNNAVYKTSENNARNAYDLVYTGCLDEVKEAKELWAQHIEYLREFMDIQSRNAAFAHNQLKMIAGKLGTPEVKPGPVKTAGPPGPVKAAPAKAAVTTKMSTSSDYGILTSSPKPAVSRRT